MYYAKINHIAVVDSFKEGNIGAATGKLAGMMQQSSGVIDLEQGNYIQQHINLLEFVKMEMSEAAGISKQREGRISASETVGGVERSNLQSSHITEWMFSIHDNTKKRALECFIETAKIAMKGNKKKFQYILPDGSLKVCEIDGDEFSENDYGIVVDNSMESKLLKENLNQLAHAALQNQTLSFSSIMKIFSSPSLSEVQRIIERDERTRMESASKSEQENIKIKQQEIEYDRMIEEQKIDLENEMNQRDNETKIIIEQIKLGDSNAEILKEQLFEKIRQFDSKMEIEREKLSSQKNIEEKKIQLKKNQLDKNKK